MNTAIRRLFLGTIAVNIAVAVFLITLGEPFCAGTSLVSAAITWGYMRLSAIAHGIGWCDGRAALVASLNEAHARRMPLEDWAASQLEVDIATMRSARKGKRP